MLLGTPLTVTGSQSLTKNSGGQGEEARSLEERSMVKRKPPLCGEPAPWQSLGLAGPQSIGHVGAVQTFLVSVCGVLLQMSV
jgi:hypothetical protein